MAQRSTAIRDRHRRAIAKDRPPCSYVGCLFPGEPIDYEAASHLDPRAFTVDHTLPLRHGGTDTLDNKTAMHRACNRHKSDRLAEGQAPAARTFVTSLSW